MRPRGAGTLQCCMICRPFAFARGVPTPRAAKSVACRVRRGGGTSGCRREGIARACALAHAFALDTAWALAMPELLALALIFGAIWQKGGAQAMCARSHSLRSATLIESVRSALSGARPQFPEQVDVVASPAELEQAPFRANAWKCLPQLEQRAHTCV